jgi:hypothetical protein
MSLLIPPSIQTQLLLQDKIFMNSFKLNIQPQPQLSLKHLLLLSTPSSLKKLICCNLTCPLPLLQFAAYTNSHSAFTALAPLDPNFLPT